MNNSLKTDKIVDDFFSQEVLLRNNKNVFIRSLDLICEKIREGGFIYTCGNGGSSSDSMHIVGELRKKFMVDRRLSDLDCKLFASMKDFDGLKEELESGIPAFSLCSEISFLTAWINDKNPQYVFAQQIFVLGRKGDLFIPLSTSGNSRNVCLAVQVAKAKGMKIISFTGAKDSELSMLSDYCLRSSSNSTPHVQEDHVKLYHLLCHCLETVFFA